MQTKEEEQKTIYPPKPLWNLRVQLIASIPFVALGIVLLNEDFVTDLATKLHVLSFLTMFLLVIFVISYSTQPSNSAVVSKGQDLMIYKKEAIIKGYHSKSEIIKEYRLDDIKEFVARNIRRNAEKPRYELAIEKHSGDYEVLFKSEFIYSRRQWDFFSEKLSHAAKKPLRKEDWAENYDGKLTLISLRQMMAGKKNIKIAFLIPLSISFIGALCFKLLPSAKSFLFLGLGSVLINLSIFFLYTLKNKEWAEEFSNNYISIFGMTFTLIVPYTFQYLMFVIALMGFSISNITKLFY